MRYHGVKITTPKSLLEYIILDTTEQTINVIFLNGADLSEFKRRVTGHAVCFWHSDPGVHNELHIGINSVTGKKDSVSSLHEHFSKAEKNGDPIGFSSGEAVNFLVQLCVKNTQKMFWINSKDIFAVTAYTSKWK